MHQTNVQDWTLVGASLSSGLWSIPMSEVNEALTLVLTILGIVLAIVRIYNQVNKDGE